MGNKNKEKKPSESQLAKQAIANKYQTSPIIVEAKFSSTDRGYAAVDKDHIQLFKFNKGTQDVSSVGTYEFSEYDTVTIDKFAVKAVMEFKGMNKTFVFMPIQQTNDIERLIKTNTSIQIDKVERKLHNKILGFRSNTKWKMILASAVYLFIMVAAVSGFMDKKEEKFANSQASQTNNAPTKKSSALDHAPKETSNKPKDTAVKMDDGRNVNMEIYNKYNVKYQSFEPTENKLSKDTAVMEHFEERAQKYNMSVPEYIEKEDEIVAVNVQKEKEAKQKADEENKQRAANRPGLTKEKFDRIQNGMTYEQVQEIIGTDGELISEGGDKGTEYYTVMYMWKGVGSTGANANFMFQGGKLNNKAQFGLK
ncbi:DUF3862 domain-containing protein (plasmid) [Bacillus mycoides]|uniref:DUF3862 domain-containing protein n=1 Tax=Bacillus mycoides TaxID=1405 RepID=UPI001C02B23D|nr:DUF3862 domain-containing protein [Bacillus mycoides]QWH63953.1 DUF3862 domain-containing protein [Bacillus mycoides]